MLRRPTKKQEKRIKDTKEREQRKLIKSKTEFKQINNYIRLHAYIHMKNNYIKLQIYSIV